MISKANITKFSAVLIIFVAGVFFMLSGYAPSKARSVANSPDTNSVAINKPETTSVVVNKLYYCCYC